MSPKSNTLAERAGGLVIAGFDGKTAQSAPLDVLSALAGVILYARNLESAAQAAALTEELQDAATAAGAPPLIVAIDEEGGTVSRLAGFGTTMPAAMCLGATFDPGVTRGVYRAIGEELAAIGVTLDFAPVADTNTNPDNPVIGVRSFGETNGVAQHVEAAIEGLHDAGVHATAKHFPGHGDATVDSHIGLPVIEHDLARLRDVELVPFRAAIEAGVDAIMTAHVALPLIDPSGTPATLSHAILTTLLRDELGFEGVVFTDCMQMQAIAGSCGPGEAAVAAIAAGADLVAFSSSMGAARAAVAALREAIASGRLDARSVERSLARVDALRTAAKPRNRALDIAAVGGEEHRGVALAAARKGVTLVRDPAGSLPLDLHAGQRIFLVQFAGAPGTPAESTGKQSTHFGKLLAAGPARVQEQLRSLDPAGHEYKQLLMAAGTADVLIAVTRRAWAHRLQAQAVEDLALAGKPVVVVAAREPYDANVAPSNAAVIATYGDDDASMEAAADVLLGKRAAEGHLPVSLGAPASSPAQ